MVIALLLAAAAPSLPARPNECRTLRGRAFLANGTPGVRIGVVGTKRILGVVQQDLTYRELPASLRRIWDSRGRAAWGTDVFGDFTVCAVTRSTPGRMQLVRITAARDLRAQAR